MGHSSTRLDWPSFWMMFISSTPDIMRATWRELNASDDFEMWLRSRTPKVQIEILESAPDQVREHLYRAMVMHPFTAEMLGVSGPTKVIDRRYRAQNRQAQKVR